jgi:hypothetical protein
MKINHSTIVAFLLLLLIFIMPSLSCGKTLNPKAENKLGNGYHSGLGGVKHSYHNAFYWYRIAAAQGNAAAESNLAYAYEHGLGVKQNYSKSVYWLKKSAAQGYAEAEDHLAYAYYAGHGVPKNYFKAFYLLKKAIAKGYIAAKYHLGMVENKLGYAYEQGQGMPKNYSKAVYWWKKATAHGNIAAQDNIGYMYYDGEVIPKKWIEANYWYKFASKQGNKTVKTELNKAYRYNYMQEDFKKAVYWWNKTAEQGDVIGQVALGYCFYKGYGVAKNYTEALELSFIARHYGFVYKNKFLNDIKHRLTASQIAEARLGAQEWVRKFKLFYRRLLNLTQKK